MIGKHDKQAIDVTVRVKSVESVRLSQGCVANLI